MKFEEIQRPRNPEQMKKLEGIGVERLAKHVDELECELSKNKYWEEVHKKAAEDTQRYLRNDMNALKAKMFDQILPSITLHANVKR